MLLDGDLPLHGLDEETALHTILQGTSTETGERFFQALVQHLANILKTHGAWVTECLLESRRLRAFAFWMDGRCAEAIRAAQDLMTTVPVEVARRVPELEFVLTTPVLSFVRCGQWDDVVRHPAPPADLTYSMALWHYARGLAFVALGRLSEADRAATSIDRTSGHRPA